MLETVVGEFRPIIVSLTDEVKARFAATRESIKFVSTLMWGEHCSECVMPSCYQTCAFYTPRRDLKCRRFDQGLQAVRVSGQSIPIGARVSFRKWGKLEAAARPTAMNPVRASRLARADAVITSLLTAIPLPRRTQEAVVTVWNKAKARIAATGRSAVAFDSFLIECVSESPRDCVFTFTVKPAAYTKSYFQRHFTVSLGYNRIEIDAAAIREAVDLEAPVLVQIEPVNPPENSAFIFGCLEFVAFGSDRAPRGFPATTLAHEAPQQAKPASKVKCVVWDLDNTLWRGTLIEDGLDKLILNDAAVEALSKLDQRGILNSIASKNNAEDALAALDRFGLRDYFLAPQIGWGPKSASISEIARRLNIHKNSFLLIDDQEFERSEVACAHPDVRVMNETRIRDLADLPELDVPVTPEAQNRRQMYKMEEMRDSALLESKGTFLEFLKSCNLTLTISNIKPTNLARVFELAQRTNQLNYAGKVSTRKDVEDLLNHVDPVREAFVLSCRDRFGDYGVIGLAVVDVGRFHVENFFMSCRVQHKKVDHAFFGWLIRRAQRRGKEVVSTAFRFSGRNDAARQALAEMNFSPANAVDVYVSPRLDALPQRDIVKVTDETERPAELTAAEAC